MREPQSRRIGAYILPGDPIWLAESLHQYYPLLDDLVVPVPKNNRGWMGQPVQVDECLEIIRRVDVRGIMRIVEGEWTDSSRPLAMDTAQRQTAIDALTDTVDWVLQLDNDEFLPDVAGLLGLIDLAEVRDVVGVELPMRVLFRRTRRHVFEVVEWRGGVHHEYPGPVAVRAGTKLANARQIDGPVLRAVALEAARSTQVRHALRDGEQRVEVDASIAIVHNSWARAPESIRRKMRGWGHTNQVRQGRYFWLRWWPTPFTWWLMVDWHPIAGRLWPRLRRLPNAGVVGDSPRLVDPADATQDST